MGMLWDHRQELFCQLLVKGKRRPLAARMAGYKCTSTGAALLRRPEIQARVAELLQKIEDANILPIKERKERLSEIARAKLTDYVELGQDGAWVNIGKETPNGGAIQEIHSRTEYDENGSKPTVHTSVKLHDPIRAIAELNKMDHVYADLPVTNITNNDNRQVNIVVVSPEAKSLTDKIIEGERT